MPSFPTMQKPDVPYEVYEMTYHDGSTRSVYVSDSRRSTKHKMIVSKTDTDGVITYVNDAFVQISGYQEADLIGQPQHVLRHPDMPSVLFKEMWATIKQGKTWTGNVKNLCCDGSHYWVNAVIAPIVRGGEIIGYNSVRRWISDEEIEKTEAAYNKL